MIIRGEAIIFRKLVLTNSINDSVPEAPMALLNTSKQLSGVSAVDTTNQQISIKRNASHQHNALIVIDNLHDFKLSIASKRSVTISTTS
jgi:hypothetical protein